LRSAASDDEAHEADQRLDPGAEAGDLRQRRGQRPGDAGEGDQVQRVAGEGNAEAECDQAQQGGDSPRAAWRMAGEGGGSGKGGVHGDLVE
jgi:hypothetical protein